MSMYAVRLECDACSKPPYNHDGCARYVRAFIEPSGPDSYACECYCNKRRQRKATGDRKVKELLDAYKREFGAEAVVAVIAPYLPSSSEAEQRWGVTTCGLPARRRTSMGDAKEHVIDAEKRNTREACSAWPPVGLCGRCHGNGGWYSRLGPADWDWTTCQECRGTGNTREDPADGE